MTQSMPKHVLDGYKVLDFTHYVAGRSSRSKLRRTATRGVSSPTCEISAAPTSCSKTAASKAFALI